MIPSRQTIDKATKIYTDFIDNYALYDLVEHRLTLNDFLCNIDEDKWKHNYQFFTGAEKIVVDFDDDDYEKLSTLFDEGFAAYITIELNLNDFHRSNMGFSKNGYLKLTDFSGYGAN